MVDARVPPFESLRLWRVGVNVLVVFALVWCRNLPACRAGQMSETRDRETREREREKETRERYGSV
jgi:hypothetical protein